jgi:predicted transcriptional regulator
MTEVKPDISLSEPLLEQVEALAQEMRISLNRLFSLALEEFIQRQQNRQLFEKINEAYADGPDEEEREWLTHARESYRRLLENEQ